SHAKMKDFLELIALEQEAGDRGALGPVDQFNDDVVHIQTCHSAKGLEFRYVFIVNLVDRRFPTVEREDAIELPQALIKEVVPQGDAHLEEERRLFYVALTRAKDICFLLSSEDYGGVRKKKPSRFLVEMGAFGLSSPTRSGIQRTDDRSLLLDSPAKGGQATLRGNDIHGQEKPPLQPTPYTLPTTYSYSQLAAFQKCPLQYKFAFLLKIPVFGKASLSFGRTLHETLHRFFESIQARQATHQQSLFMSPEKGYTDTHESSLPALDDLLMIYEESWIDEWYANERQALEYREKGKDILKRLYAELVEKPPSPRWLEKDFTIKVGSGDSIHTIKGRIDRIDTALNGGVEIIDYKTGASKDHENFKAEDKEQLLFYQIATEEVLKEKPISLTYYYLDDGKKISFLGTDEEKEKLKVKTATIIEKIQKSDFTPTPGWHCKFCDFRDICEFRKY
ncbi:MAG: PD-(D/E)XK nuclease family protein, partial [bacterium]|nr:PD-(D/E)XK nuclease family protein [bacterium]